MKKSKKIIRANEHLSCNSKSQQTIQLCKSLDKNISLIKKVFHKDETLMDRQFQNKYLAEAKCAVLYVKGLVNIEMINENIIEPILRNDLRDGISQNNLLEELQNKVILCNDITLINDINKIFLLILSGDTLLLLNGYNSGLIIHTKEWPARSPDEPNSEMVIRGPREGFTESIIMNLGLIRRKLKTPDLKFIFKELGTRSNTKICICYLEELADPKIVRELDYRLNQVSIDGILDSGYIQEIIKDSPFSPFKTIGNTERPDVVAGKLLEGRVAVIVDGSPSVLTLPFVFVENFQTSEDYYHNYYMGSINRLLRIIGFILTISAPAIYVALITFHQEMIPSMLLISIAASRQDVPFPTIIEVMGMLLVFEMLRETSIRMPSSIGQATSIVGALVLGQAAVDARLVSSAMVIVVGFTGITGLLIPKIKGASIVFRLLFLLLVSILGLYGYIFGLIGLLLLLFSMRSFGIPYMQNIGSLKTQEAKDVIVRAPWWYMDYRPQMIGAKNSIRQKLKRGKLS